MERAVVAVRYGLMAVTENFVSSLPGLKRGDVVIIRTGRGIDHGIVAQDAVPTDREVKGLGEVLRLANEKDVGIIRHIADNKEPEELHYCADRVAERSLPMKLVGVEHLFSGDKLVFYFLSDGRVDFRELVKDLARRYRTRIEMRQIGVRDEARLLADYEHCGRELCCRTFLRNLEPVTMRMAKIQKTTLDPTKISGHCGRLMCCLRFEDQVYSILRGELPRKGEQVRTPHFVGEVQGHNIIKQEVVLTLPDGSRETVHVSEIVERLSKGGRRPSGGGAPRGEGRREGRGGEASRAPAQTESEEPADEETEADVGGEDGEDAEA